MSERPITILIAALGGQGGGVLTGFWRLPPATGSPRRARRYLGWRSVPARPLITWRSCRSSNEYGGRRPIFSLICGIGDIDILLASELMEASRAVGEGFVRPQRTLVIALTSRTFVMEEKMAMVTAGSMPSH